MLVLLRMMMMMMMLLLLMMIIASPGNRWRGTVNLLPDLFGMMIAHDRMHLTVIPNE